MDATKQYIVTTITGYVLLAVWLASVLAQPILVLDPAVQTAIFGIAVAALGLQTYTGYRAANTLAQSERDRDGW